MWQSPVVWVTGLVAIALAIAVAIGVSSTDGDTAAGDETAFAEIIGAPLPDLTSPDPALGTEAPRVVATNLDGERVRLGGDGTARLYGFFTHWCPVCQRELPRTAAWLNANELPDGVEVVAISTSVDATAGNYPPSAWFARENWPAEVLLDSETSAIGDGFGLTAFPFWVAVDADGTVVARFTGEVDDASFATLIQGLAS
jgi:thiol-disulfide isomerase/thioredoxin